MQKLSLFILAGLIGLLMGFFWWSNEITPINPNDKTVIVFVINKGEGVNLIADNLKNKNLIKDTLVFKIVAKYLGIGNKIQAGDFRLSPSMSVKKIALELTHGTQDAWVTIPEGLRIEEIAIILNKSLKIDPNEFVVKAKSSEGYLFPDTYAIPKTADIKQIIQIMTSNFNNKVGKIINLEAIQRGELNPNGLTFDQVITLASIIEREARLESDRPKIASVLYNRLNIGMKLDIDATVQYAISSQNCQIGITCDWWPKNLTLDDLAISSPFNTYKNAGLPPSPIDNPGLAVIKAALQPEKTDYLFYVADKLGQSHFANTLEQHNQNVSKYISN